MKYSLIPYSERAPSKHCFFCGTNQSVKYRVTLEGAEIPKSKIQHVLCCNACIVRLFDSLAFLRVLNEEGGEETG